MSSHNTAVQRRSPARTIARVLLGLALIFAGTSHLTFAREEFDAQVPSWVPMDRDTVVLISGGVEITLGAMLIAARKRRGLVGVVTALFFIAIFPGNIAQWMDQRDAFGLDTDTKRFVRLFFQPLLVVWAWWSTGPRERRRKD
ncbi:DoxX family protein [Jonesia quinghaiensis]|uniref:DoxX family protein n=1 Tax=Jonesia quinghaiensis TaxID=262806 RepID=UPI0003FE6873|nr:membrane protein [Jonesia quinghaiensis]